VEGGFGWGSVDRLLALEMVWEPLLSRDWVHILFSIQLSRHVRLGDLKLDSNRITWSRDFPYSDSRRRKWRWSTCQNFSCSYVCRQYWPLWWHFISTPSVRTLKEFTVSQFICGGGIWKRPRAAGLVIWWIRDYLLEGNKSC